MLDIILDTLLDTLKLIPFLFVAFLIIELIEHKLSDKNKNIIKKSGKYGPVIGGLLGAIPQCGFSVMATNLYVTRIISIGTLVSIYLSCSDEMLPILISENAPYNIIISIILIKISIGIISGIIIDLIYRNNKNKFDYDICDHEHCHCDKENIFKSSLIHTLKISLFILIINFILNSLFHYGGEELLSNILLKNSILSSFMTCIIGLIPNCGASVLITELYINNVITLGATIAGLLSGSGVAILVLFRTNNNIKDSLKILLLVYGIGVISGIIIDLIMML